MKLVLVGAGHAHLHLLAFARTLRAAGLDLTLIAPERFHYSGLATGVLSGALPVEAAEINVAALAAANGVRHLAATVVGADLQTRVLQLHTGQAQGFDLLSLNVGSQVRDPLHLASAPGVFPVKPLAGLFALRDQLEAALAEPGPGPQVVVAGGGQTGFEVTAALAGLYTRHGRAPQVTLVAAHSPSFAPQGALADLTARLQSRGVSLLTGEIVARRDGTCQLADGRELSCEMLVLATGLVAPTWLAQLGLAVDGSGRVQLTPYLQALGEARVFAAGDCAVIAETPRPAVGVFGVRAAPILLSNLLATATGVQLRSYRPQSHWLSIMDLGDETGLALWRSLWWRGAAALRLKRWLDLSFVAKARGARSSQALEERHHSAGAR